MLLGILSDTHNQVDRTRQALNLLRAEGAEALIHAGDLNSEPIVFISSRGRTCNYIAEAGKEGTVTRAEKAD